MNVVADRQQSAPAHPVVSESAASPSDFDEASLDDPSQRLAVAALDVLAAAQDQARQHLAASQGSHQGLARVIDGVGSEADEALARFHAELDATKARLVAEDTGASLGEDGVGGDSLRSYEFGLLLNSQRTAERVTQLAQTEADRVTHLARTEAGRVLAHADDQVAELEKRIDTLRKVEADLQHKVADQLRTQV